MEMTVIISWRYLKARKEITMWGFLHNVHVLKQAEETVNSFIESPDTTVWFEDEEGNCFVPKGTITINHYEVTTERK